LLTGLSVTHVYRLVIHARGWKKLSIGALSWRILLASMICGFFITFLNFMFTDIRDGLVPFIDRLNPTKFLENFLSLSFLCILWSFIYFAIAQFENYKKEEISNLQLRAAKTEIELNSFRSQMNPHFMFNCMNSIRALVDENPDKAKNAITLLSGILRNNLMLGKRNTVQVKDELDLVEKYLTLEKIRFEERLRIRIDVTPVAMSFDVPPFMIQTLVENAIKHGISRIMEGGSVEVTIVPVDEYRYRISIANSGTWNNEGPETGVGLQNTIKRLDLLYHGQAAMQIHKGENTVTTEITLPQKLSV
ncbi:MAG: histidine kinase, partial [Flavobacteriales bacterium]|nr:histidine kinase [Flavobacteriales bacterium]